MYAGAAFVIIELSNHVVDSLGLYKKEQVDEALELMRTGWEKRPIHNHLYFLHLQEAENAAAVEKGLI